MKKLIGNQRVPVKLVDVEGTATFIYVEEGMREEESYQAPLSSTGIEIGEVTHVDETTLPDAPVSINGGASQAASISVNMDPVSKRMVDDLVDSEMNDDGEDAELIDHSANEPPHSFADPRYGPAKDVGDETSYGLIGTSPAREHFGDLQGPVPNSPRPRLPSIINSPFALQPGEETPGSRPSTSKRKTPSHSQQNSQTRFPLQRQPNALSSSPSNPSTMPDPTAPNIHANAFYHNQAPLKDTFPLAQNYTRGPRTLTAFRDNPLHADEPNFLSAEVFEGSTYGGSDQSGRKATNIMTPPNGQGAG